MLVDRKLLFIGLALGLAVLFLVGSQLLAGVNSQPQNKLPEFTIGEYSNKTSSAKPSFNAKDYAFTLSSKKPEAVIASFAGEDESLGKEATELTVYNQNLALVKENRILNLKKGLNLVKYTDIAALIKPESVLFKDLEDPSTFVVEQNYEYDLASKSRLLEKYLGKEITVKTKDEQVFTGKLLSYSAEKDLDQLLLQTGDKVVSLNEVQEIYFPKLLGGLLAKPSLVWKLYTESDGNRQTQTTYLTKGLTWQADYIAKINQDDSQVNFSGWVTVKNTSGTSYPSSTLKLVAGDLHLAGAEQRYLPGVAYKEAVPVATPNQFKEEGLYEYHLYSLERVTDIGNNETKQISLLSAPSVSVVKKFVFDPVTGWYRSYSNNNSSQKKVQVLLEFKNSKEKGLGMPLPKGTVRVYKEDSQGKLQFVGEDSIDHTPKDEEVSLLTGYAFDIVGEKKTTGEEKLGKNCREYSYEVKLRNHKNEAVTVYAIEHTYGDNKVVSSSHPYEKKDAYKYEFKVGIPANGESTLTYTIRTCW